MHQSTPTEPAIQNNIIESANKNDSHLQSPPIQQNSLDNERFDKSNTLLTDSNITYVDQKL